MEVLVITLDWAVPYIAYLLRQELPEDEDEARQIVRRSKAFTVTSGQLYRESVTGVAQRCISPPFRYQIRSKEGNQVRGNSRFPGRVD